MITSKGAVGVTGSGFIVLAGTLSALGGAIPVVTVAVLLGVDKFMSEMRAFEIFVEMQLQQLLLGMG